MIMRRIEFLALCRVMTLALVCVGAIYDSKGIDLLTLNSYGLRHGVLVGEVETFAPVGEQLRTLMARTEAGEIRVTPQKDFYAMGEEVELELDLAKFPSPIPTTNGPTALQRFVGWSGDAGGTENPL